jgi:hypothetical protein
MMAINRRRRCAADSESAAASGLRRTSSPCIRAHGELDVLEPGEKLLEERPQLHAREVSPETEVDPDPEGDVPIGVGPADVETKRVVEHGLVAIGGQIRAW